MSFRIILELNLTMVNVSDVLLDYIIQFNDAKQRDSDNAINSYGEEVPWPGCKCIC